MSQSGILAAAPEKYDEYSDIEILAAALEKYGEYSDIEILTAALEKYREHSDIEILRIACSEYESQESHEDALPDSLGKLESIRRGFKSFNIAPSNSYTPSNSYKRYMDAVKIQSDAEAIASDWAAVGEDLIYSLMQYIIKEKQLHE